MTESRFGRVLRSVNSRAAFHKGEGFANCLASENGKSVEQFAGGLALAYFDLFLQEHVARVHFPDRSHNGNAGIFVAVEHRPLYGGRASVTRQQRGVNVEHAVREQRNELFGENLTERGGNGYICSERRDFVNALARNFFVLQHGNTQRSRALFKGRRTQSVTASRRSVGIGHRGNNVEFRGKRAQYDGGKIRSSEKKDFHSSSCRSEHFEV